MKTVILPCLLAMAFLSAACSGPQSPGVKMKTEQTDAAKHSQCLEQCTQEQASCRNLAKNPERTEVSGPQEVSKEEWAKVFKATQEAEKKCESTFQACQEGCSN